MAWPNYQQVPLRSLTLRELLANDRLFKTIRAAVLILILAAVYLVGTHLTLLPFLNRGRFQVAIEQSEFFVLLDQLFTGGSLSTLSPFAAGILPLLLFRNWSPAGRRSGRRWRLSFPASVAFIIIIALFILYLSSNGFAQGNFLDLALSFFYFLLGSALLFFINYQLSKNKGPSIITLNALVIAFIYARSLLFVRQSSELVVLVLVLLFMGSFVLLVRYVKYVPLVNIRAEVIHRGQLPLPATNSFMRFTLLIATFVLLTLITTLLNFVLHYSLNPFGNSLLDEVFLIVIILALSLVLFSNDLLDSALSQFSGPAAAYTLMTNYWLISDPPTPIGEPTAHLLSREALRSHRLNYIFYLVWAVLFSLVELCVQLLHLPLKLFPFGLLGFLIILTLCCDFCYTLFGAIYRFVQSARFGELWVPSTSTLSNLQMLTESGDLYEVIEQILPIATEEEREQITAILFALRSGKVKLASIRQLLLIFGQISKRMTEETTGSLVAHLILLFIVCLILSLVVTVLAVLLVQLFLEHTAFSDLGIKITEVLALPGTFLALVPIVGLDACVKELFAAIRANPRSALRGMGVRNPPRTLATYELENAELAYGILLRQQREVVEETRRKIALAGDDLHADVLNMLRLLVNRLVDARLPDVLVTDEQMDRLIDALDNWHALPETLPAELELSRNRDTLRSGFCQLCISYYEERSKRFDEHLALLQKGGIHGLHFRGISQLSRGQLLSGMLLPLRALEQSFWFYFLERFWSSHADRLAAARVRMKSRLAIKKEDIAQFEKQADNDFTCLQEDIQLNTIYTLLSVLHQINLEASFPQFLKARPPETVVDASIAPNDPGALPAPPLPAEQTGDAADEE